MLPGAGNDEDSLCPSLTFQQRIYGFAGCCVVGLLLSVLSWFSMAKRDFIAFAVWSTFGNIVSLGGSCFLKGPLKQVKCMFEDKRLEATVILLCSLLWTLLAAFWLQSVFVVIQMAITQYLALAWYGLSFIPFARGAVKKCFKSVTGMGSDE